MVSMVARCSTRGSEPGLWLGRGPVPGTLSEVEPVAVDAFAVGCTPSSVLMRGLLLSVTRHFTHPIHRRGY